VNRCRALKLRVSSAAIKRVITPTLVIRSPLAVFGGIRGRFAGRARDLRESGNLAAVSSGIIVLLERASSWERQEDSSEIHRSPTTCRRLRGSENSLERELDNEVCNAARLSVEGDSNIAR